MNKRLVLLLAALPLVALTAAGCGAAGCTTAPANAQNTGAACSLAAGSAATITVALSCQCTDTDAVCDGGWRSDLGTAGGVDLGTTVHQCQDQSGCNTQGCDTSAHTASCQVTIPADAPASFPVYVNGVFNTTVTSGASSSCSI